MSAKNIAALALLEELSQDIDQGRARVSRVLGGDGSLIVEWNAIDPAAEALAEALRAPEPPKEGGPCPNCQQPLQGHNAGLICSACPFEWFYPEASEPG